MKRLSAGLSFLMLLGLAVAAHARVPVGTLAGLVLDASGKPVSGATVTIQTSFGQEPNATHTDSNGRFRFARYRTGQYDLRAYAKGEFSTWRKRVTIRAGKTTEVTLQMPPPADQSVTVTR